MRKLNKRIVGISFLTVVCIIAALVYVIQRDEKTPTIATADINEVSSMLTSHADEVFEPVLPDVAVKLPQDFSFHDHFQHEWWHFFANVVDDNGEEYGVQWSYFRIAESDNAGSGWLNPQIYVSHVVVSNKHDVWKEQRIARGGIGQAGLVNKPFRVWIDNWYWRSLGATPFPGQLVASTDNFDIDLISSAIGPYVLPGEYGYQKKHDLLPVASYNLTAPFVRVKGTLKLGNDKSVRVEGNAWLSKEWGSGLMAEGQKGWDWFVLRLNDEATLSVSRYRQDKQLPYVFGTLSTNDGKVVPITSQELILKPLQPNHRIGGKEIPTQWLIQIPKHKISLTAQAINSDLFLPFVIPYWEGPIKAWGTHNATGFMQLTGY
ncbi:lipocalin-like domain-containing protein [Vibrio japonicus]|uniref:Carotenoid 1,2-hydratase n=1 Tax=Vibrio japonicus TaxID=1824638 RepID=A0ABY5LLN4_9VIBR|nr:lipocalin-like domain-containing protein [Vibrio japonicus]UUM31672.1 carotenoid 1,2-hydratase [Vibrio japonicus]